MLLAEAGGYLRGGGLDVLAPAQGGADRRGASRCRPRRGARDRRFTCRASSRDRRTSAWGGPRCATCLGRRTRARLTVRDVDEAFEAIAEVSGAGGAVATAQAPARRALRLRHGAGAGVPRAALARGEPRLGALESLVVEALAKAAGLPAADVRRAVMLGSYPGPVAAAVLGIGGDKSVALQQFRLEVGRPIQPMLAQTAGSGVGRGTRADG